MSFIGSYICWKKKLDAGIKEQIFHPVPQSLTRMAYCSFTLSTTHEGQDLLERVQQDTKMMREHLFYEERLRQLKLFILEGFGETLWWPSST